MAKIRYDLLKAYKTKAADEECKASEELQNRIKAIKEGKGKFSVKFFLGEAPILDKEKISSIGNNAEIIQSVSYDGGSY